MQFLFQHRMISRSFFFIALLRFIYLIATNAIYGFNEVVVVAALGCLAHFAFESGSKDGMS